MTEKPLSRMVDMAGLLLEARSARLREAAARIAALQARLDDLGRPASQDALDPVVAPSLFAYESWAALRRAELRAQLLKAQAEWQAHLGEACAAFGRKDALERVSRLTRPR
ncbi:hypothetical protein [Pseudogemmobacter sonorensis]|uniref:hypothetical protein n=1 Tax=Pseudogemmobacter sonorensis TaxID=2989681 RepID=UPI0036876270